MSNTPVPTKRDSLHHYFSPLRQNLVSTGTSSSMTSLPTDASYPLATTAAAQPDKDVQSQAEPITVGSMEEKPALQHRQMALTNLTPTKKILLKVKVTNEDLDKGIGRRANKEKTTIKELDRSDEEVTEKDVGSVQSKPSSKNAAKKRSTLVGQKQRKRPPTGRPRGRPRKNAIQNQDEGKDQANTGLVLPPEPRRPVLEDFVSLSPYSFPLSINRFRKPDPPVQDGTQELPERDAELQNVQDNAVDKQNEVNGITPSIQPLNQTNNVFNNPTTQTTMASSAVPKNILDPMDPKRYCFTCGKELRVVLINRRQQCFKCKKTNPQPAPKPKSRPRLPWEIFGLETFWDINQETGIAEERVVMRRGRLPDTADFWNDMWIANQANASNNTDFKMMLLEMMRTKNANTIPKMTVAMPWKREVVKGAMSVSAGEMPPFGVDARKDAHGRLISMTTWDYMLEEMKVKRADMRYMRQYKMHGKKLAAKWAVWDTKLRRASRGEFIEADSSTPWTFHAPGVEGEITKELDLGYTRQGIDRGDRVFEKVQAEHWVDIAELRAEAEARRGRVSEEAVVDDECDDDHADGMDVD